MCAHAKLNFEEGYLNPLIVKLLGENQELEELWRFFQLKCHLQQPAGGQLLYRVVLPCSETSQRKSLRGTGGGVTPRHLKHFFG